MKRLFIPVVLIFMMAGCSTETFNIKNNLKDETGYIQINKCFCDSSAYRYLIINLDNQNPFEYNPINLSEDYKDDNYKIVFSADLLNDSSIVYTNTATDALVENFKVRNIKLTAIRKYSDLTLNDTLELVYGKTFLNYEKNVSIKLDSVLEDSRCPENVECIWSGMAIARFDFTLNNKLTTFSLTNTGGYAGDTIISGYKIQFISLKPYPVFGIPIIIKDYIAGIKISI